MDRPYSGYRELVTGLHRTGGIATMQWFHRQLLARGILITPSAGFILSTPIHDAVIDRVVGVAQQALATAGGRATA